MYISSVIKTLINTDNINSYTSVLFQLATARHIYKRKKQTKSLQYKKTNIYSHQTQTHTQSTIEFIACKILG